MVGLTFPDPSILAYPVPSPPPCPCTPSCHGAHSTGDSSISSQLLMSQLVMAAFQDAANTATTQSLQPKSGWRLGPQCLEAGGSQKPGEEWSNRLGTRWPSYTLSRSASCLGHRWYGAWGPSSFPMSLKPGQGEENPGQGDSCLLIALTSRHRLTSHCSSNPHIVKTSYFSYGDWL